MKGYSATAHGTPR